MKKRKLKSSVIYMLYGFCFIMVLSSLFILENISSKSKMEEPKIVEPDKVIPVVETEIKIIRPYYDDNVKIGKSFYDYKENDENQRKSLVNFENTYLPNTGVDYVLDSQFDVVSILDGKVVKVSQDKHLGNIVEIRYQNNLIGVYQSLSEIFVKQGDNVIQGQAIAKTGECNLSKDLKNHLHFELIQDGKNVNPEKYYEKKLEDI